MPKLFSALCLLSLLIAAPVAADSSIQVLGSYWDTDHFGDALGLAVRGSYGGEHWFFDLGTTYYEDTDGLQFVLNGDDLELGVEFSVLDAGFHRRFGDEGLRPVLGAGVSYYNFEPDLLPDIGDEFGFYGLIGFELGNGRIGFRGEAVYRDVDAEIDFNDLEELGDGFPVVLDVGLDGISFNAGMVFRLGGR